MSRVLEVDAPGDADVLLTVDVPGFATPAGWMFGHSTRLLDAWNPAVESIYLPRFDCAGGPLRVSIRDGVLPAVDVPGRRARLARSIRGMLQKDERRPVDRGTVALEQRGLYLPNIAHLIHDLYVDVSLCRQALAASGRRERVVCVIPAATPEWVRQALIYLGIDTLPTDGEVHGPLIEVVRPRRTSVLAMAFRQCTLPERDQSAAHKRLFISRRKSRRIGNESEIWPILERNGFTRMYFEETPLATQLAAVLNATSIVSIHGAALGWICFKAHESLRAAGHAWGMVEIFSSGFCLARGYREHAAVLDGSWVGVRGRVTPEVSRDTDFAGRTHAHAFDDFNVDPETIERAIDLLDRRRSPLDRVAASDGAPC